MSSASDHLSPEDLYDHVENRLPTRRLRGVEEHLASCADCAEALAMVIRAERPATREEEALLAQAPSPTPEERVKSLEAAIAASAPSERPGSVDWKPLLVAFALLVVAATAGNVFYTRYWLPASTLRIASETLEALVEMRQGTGRIPLRYIDALERASVTRSVFDDTGAMEEALLANLRDAVDRAPEPRAIVTLGLLLLDDGQLDEAEELFRRVLEIEPRSVDALNGLAVVHYARAEREAADAYALRQRGLAILREAQAADPADLRVLFNFGRFYEALEMRTAAVQAWARYLERDPSSAWAEEAAHRLRQLQPR